MNKLQEACIISHEHWLNDIEQTLASIDIDIPDIKVPKKAKEKIIPITQKNSKISKKVIKVLIIAAIIMALFMTVSAFTPFREFVVEVFEDHFLFTNDGAKRYYPKEIEITNLPEGFTMSKEENSKLSIMQEYQCGEKKFIVEKNSATAYYQVSNLDDSPDIYEVGIIKYYLYDITEYGVVQVYWLTDKYSYALVGYNLPKEEMIEIAKGIK